MPDPDLDDDEFLLFADDEEEEDEDEEDDDNDEDEEASADPPFRAVFEGVAFLLALEELPGIFGMDLLSELSLMSMISKLSFLMFLESFFFSDFMPCLPELLVSGNGSGLVLEVLLSGVEFIPAILDCVFPICSCRSVALFEKNLKYLSPRHWGDSCSLLRSHCVSE